MDIGRGGAGGSGKRSGKGEGETGRGNERSFLIFVLKTRYIFFILYFRKKAMNNCEHVGCSCIGLIFIFLRKPFSRNWSQLFLHLIVVLHLQCLQWLRLLGFVGRPGSREILLIPPLSLSTAMLPLVLISNIILLISI